MSQVNQATSQTLRTQATQEGLAPLKAWVKMVLDRVIAGCFGEADLEFCWVGDDDVDPLEQAQTISILVGAGVKTIAEARAELGLGQSMGAVKFNPYHDDQGRFTTADNGGAPGGANQFAENEYGPTMTDAGGGGQRDQVAQIDPIVPQEIEPIKPVESEPKSGPAGQSNALKPPDSFAIPNWTPSADNPADYALGYDPASGKFRPNEVETAWRLQQLLKQSLSRDSSGGAEWIGPDGIVHDAMGLPDWTYFNVRTFNNSIDRHLLKSGVTTVIDMTGASKAQINEVDDHLNALSGSARNNIIRLGF